MPEQLSEPSIPLFISAQLCSQGCVFKPCAGLHTEHGTYLRKKEKKKKVKWGRPISGDMDGEQVVVTGFPFPLVPVVLGHNTLTKEWWAAKQSFLSNSQVIIRSS